MATHFDLNLPTLTPDKVYLFYADTRQLQNTDSKRFEHWLNAAELEYIESLVFDHDKQLYKLSHCLLRWLLSEYTHESPDSIVFEKNAYGKPALKHQPEIQFNLSHSNGQAVVAITKNHSLGVDLEKVEFEKNRDDILNHFFHHEECSQFTCLTKTDKNILFTQLWTLKESFIKAAGKGLSIALDSFYFDCKNTNNLKFYADESLNINQDEWLFSTYRSQQDTNFLTSVAINTISDVPQEMHIKAFNINLLEKEVKERKQKLMLFSASD